MLIIHIFFFTGNNYKQYVFDRVIRTYYARPFDVSENIIIIYFVLSFGLNVLNDLESALQRIRVNNHAEVLANFS